ncbi:MAG: FAD-dependent oxidoreductase [Myxococcota bacterium]
MPKKITRRDFINGVSVAAAGAAVMDPSTVWAEMAKRVPSTPGPADDYPPTRTGLRGNHDGTYDVAHALAWNGQSPASYEALDEAYDLVVVGTGISGLSAAYFYQREAGKDKRILLLDNHDDFGGHAKRNEFHFEGQMLVSGGGSGNIEDPGKYSAEAKRLLAETGLDVEKIRQGQIPRGFAAEMDAPLGMYNDAATYGKDSVVTGPWMPAWQAMGNYKELINALPLPEREREKLIGFVDGSRPLEKPLPDGDLLKTLKRTPYQTFAVEHVGLSKQTTRLFDPYLRVTHCTGTDSISIMEGIKAGLPALAVLGEKGMAALQSSGFAFEGVDFVWPPDGNATITRQLVRRLIPSVAPGQSIEGLTTARFDYGRLDHPDHPVRLRLNSTVTRILNESDGSVSIAYVRDGKPVKVKSKHCIFAGFNGMTRHVCPQLPEDQKKNASYGVKSPLLLAHVLIRKARPFLEAGGQVNMCPNSYFALVTTGMASKIGDYETPTGPDDPLLVYMMTSPPVANDGTQSAADLYRQARRVLYATPFDDFEKIIREQLSGLLANTDFDADRDIQAITLNRWSHGYAYGYMDLHDPEFPEGEAPHELGRKPLGNISFAGSDTEARAYADAAIDAAWRAVQEQLEG